MERLVGRVAVVTGGASGIGQGMARRLAQEGMKIVIADVDEAGMAATVAELSATGAEAIAVRTDVSSLDSVEALAAAATKRFGAVHLLCNNAGVGGFQRFLSTSQRSWDWQLGVNLWGPIHGCRVFLPILVEQEEGHIVNTASMAGFIATPYLAPYSVSKAGIVALTESLFRELAQEAPHVGVSVLCPSYTATAIDNDQRSAPADVERRTEVDPEFAAIRQAVYSANAAGQTPAQVADFMVEGVRARKLHIFPQPDWLARIEERTANIVNGEPIDTAFTGKLKTR